MRKNAGELIDRLNEIKDKAELLLEDYVSEYSEYGIDSTANDLIGIVASMDAVRLKLHNDEVRPF